MKHKRDLYERTLRKTHPNRVLVKGLESELRKYKSAAERAQREIRVLRAIRRIHRLPAQQHGCEHFASAACVILMEEGAYRDARISLHAQEISHPVVGTAGCAAGFTETLYAEISHGGRRYGRLGVSILPTRDDRDREEEIRLLSEAASEIGLGLHRIEIRDESLPAWQGSQEFSLPVGALSAAQL